MAHQAEKLKIPYIIIPRCQMTTKYLENKKIKKIIANFLLFSHFAKKAIAVQFLSKQEKDDSMKYYSGLSFISPNGIDMPLESKQYKKSNAIVGTFIGRYSIWQKGLDMLIEAISRKKEELLKEQISFKLYGPTERTGSESEIEKLVEKYGVKDIVQVNGPVFDDEKRDVLLDSDFFIHTSRFEGMPMSVLEALSYGLPCLVTQGSNLREEVDKLQAGWGVDNTVDSITDGISKIILDKQQISNISKNALILAKNYSWDNIAVQCHEFFVKILEKTERRYKMKILVTGANGYLGQGVVRKLLDMNANVIATDFKSNNIDRRATIIEANLFEVEKPYEFFGEPDVVLHMAWRDGFIHYSNTHIEDLPKHYEFLKKLSESGIKKIVVMGSMHEVGFWEGAIKEYTPCNPLSLYGVSKNALRDLVKLLAKQNNIKFQWLRGYYIVGNSKYGSSIFSKITAAADEGKKEFPFTYGQNQYDFINYEDFCYQTAAAVVQDKILGIINICSGKPEKLADRVERFIKENNYKIKLQYGAFPDRPYDSKAVWGDSSKIDKIIMNINT